MFWETSVSSSVNLYTYENILLKTYIAIADKGDLSLLIISGIPTNMRCLEAWENIIKTNERETGGNTFGSYFQLLKGYALLINDHVLIRSCLIHCAISPLKWEYLETLKDKGYTIDFNNIGESVNAGLQRCNNLITKAVMKKNEIERIMSARKSSSHSFSEILVNLNMNVGFPVDENIKLSMYNAYNKSLKARQKAEEDRNNRKK